MEQETEVWKPKVVWKHAFYHFLLHIALIYGIVLIASSRISLWTGLWAFAIYGIGGIGTGIGSHRFFAHKSFKGTRAFKILMICCQTFAGILSVRYFVQTHRIHHKFNDTNSDPSNIKRGFFFAYVGNYFLTRHPDCQKEWDRLDLSDIDSDPDLSFQNENYPSLWVAFAMVLPIFVPFYFWNESLWIATWMNLFRSYFNVTHIGYSNSINHVFGARPFDGSISATDNFYVNLYLFGEGNHNFHHTFPQDYKGAELAGLRNFNILTTIIHVFEKLGCVYDFKSTSPETIAKRLKRTGDGSYVHKETGFNSISE